jgi:hypothetical protein
VWSCDCTVLIEHGRSSRSEENADVETASVRPSVYDVGSGSSG